MFVNKCVRGNPDLCMGCRTCLIACVEAHTDKNLFEIQPDSINFNPKLHMIKSYDITVPYQCRHCENPECMTVCTKGAIYHDEDRVLIDAGKCDGCGDCEKACPFGAIDMVKRDAPDAKGNELIANKCDLCKGVEGGPACVRVCPTCALSVVDTDEVKEKAELKRQKQLWRKA